MGRRRTSEMSSTHMQRRARAAALAATTAAGFLAYPGLLSAAAAMPDVGAGFTSGGGRPFDTIIVVDAGSSGCRLNVYHLNGEGESVSVSGMAGDKIEPGLNSFADRPADAAQHVKPMLLAASELVPPERHANTKVFIKSTAGMRLLPEETQEAIYDEIYGAIAADSSFPFPMAREELGTIGGDMEAFYAVLSANYLEGRIDARLHPTGHPAGEIGALDMGGASTQIIFRHETASEGVLEVVVDSHHVLGLNGEEGVLEEGDTTVTVPVTPSDFWGMSHLGYGVSEVRAKVWEFLVDEHAQAGRDETEVVANPCSFVDRVDVWKGHRLVGVGDHASCEQVVKNALWDGDGHHCGADTDRVCGVGGVTMPPPRGEFLAMSVFFYGMHCLHELGPVELTLWPSPSLAEVRNATEAFCAMDWKEMMHEDEAAGISKVSHAFTGSTEALAHRCVEAVYMTTLLRDGYGFEDSSRKVTFALEAEGTELEWTLGYALAELADGFRKLENPPETSDVQTAAAAGVNSSARVIRDERDGWAVTEPEHGNGVVTEVQMFYEMVSGLGTGMEQDEEEKNETHSAVAKPGNRSHASQRGQLHPFASDHASSTEGVASGCATCTCRPDTEEAGYERHQRPVAASSGLGLDLLSLAESSWTTLSNSLTASRSWAGVEARPSPIAEFSSQDSSDGGRSAVDLRGFLEVWTANFARWTGISGLGDGGGSHGNQK